jgi:predicted enzyme related to lactoylglutathione lyase
MASHPIVHVEIAATDPKVSGAFYDTVFGWKQHVEPNFDYHMFEVAGGPGGAFVKVGSDDAAGSSIKPSEVLLYIGSDDIDADLAKVEANGGKKLVGKTEIPQTGWFGIFSDPGGTKVALYTPLQRS